MDAVIGPQAGIAIGTLVATRSATIHIRLIAVLHPVYARHTRIAVAIAGVAVVVNMTVLT
jgi:hypothetical protein